MGEEVSNSRERKRGNEISEEVSNSRETEKESVEELEIEMSEEVRNSRERANKLSQEASRSRKAQILRHIKKKQEEILQSLEREMGVTEEDNIQKEIEELKDIKKNQEERIKNLESKALQIANLYFVFQGVIFTSTSTASSLQCHDWWFPFTLSLLAAVLNFFAFRGAVCKGLRYRDDLDQISADLEDRKRAKVSGSSSNPPGADSSQPALAQAQPPRSSHFAPGPDKWKQCQRWVAVQLAQALLIGFTVVIMIGCRTLLCKSTSDDCLKHCQRSTAG